MKKSKFSFAGQMRYQNDGKDLYFLPVKFELHRRKGFGVMTSFVPANFQIIRTQNSNCLRRKMKIAFFHQSSCCREFGISIRSAASMETPDMATLAKDGRLTRHL